MLEEIAQSAVSFQKANRYFVKGRPPQDQQPAQLLADDLRRFVEGKVPWYPLNPLQRLWRRGRQPRVMIRLDGLALVGLLISGLGLGLWRSLDDLRREKGRGDVVKEQKKEEAEKNARHERAQKVRDYAKILQEVRQLLDAGQTAAADEQLNRCPPELRDWEWHHLRRQREGAIRSAQFGRPIQCLAVGPGPQIAVVLDDGRVRVSNWQDDWAKETRHRFNEWPERNILQVAFARKPGALLTASVVELGHVLCGVVDVHPLGEGIHVEPRHDFFLTKEGEAPVNPGGRMALHPDGHTLVYSGEPRRLKVLDLEHPDAVDSFGAEEGAIPAPIRGLAFSPSGDWLAAVCGSPGDEADKRRLLLWSWPGRKLVRRELDGPARDVSLDANGRRAAVLGDDGQVTLWDIRDGRAEPSTVHIPAAGHTAVRCLAFHPGNELVLATGGGKDSGEVFLWELRGREAVRHTREGHKTPVTCLAFDADQELLVSGARDGSVHASNALLKKPEPRAAGPDKVTFQRDVHSADGRLRAEVIAPNALRLSTVPEPITVNRVIVGIALSPSGKRLAVIDEQSRVMLYDVETGEELLRLPLAGEGPPSAMRLTEADELIVRWGKSEWHGQGK